MRKNFKERQAERKAHIASKRLTVDSMRNWSKETRFAVEQKKRKGKEKEVKAHKK